MTIMAVPYHLDERLDGFTTGLVHDREIAAELPPGDPWQRMTVLYERVAQAVAEQSGLVAMISGDCTTSLGVLAGLQRAGRDPGIVWFDGHADFHTQTSTTSGYLGGMSLALAAGIGTQTLPAGLGLRATPASRILLVNARDTDPGEEPLLANAGVPRRPARAVEWSLPEGELYLHIDVDVCAPEEIPDLLYPASGGLTVDTLVDAVRTVISAGRVAAVGIATTWRHRGTEDPAQRHLMHALHEVITR